MSLGHLEKSIIYYLFLILTTAETYSYILVSSYFNINILMIWC